MDRFWPHRVVRRGLLTYFRLKAIESWHPAQYGGAVLLAISQENLCSLDEWKRLCPQTRVIHLPGTHTSTQATIAGGPVVVIRDNY